MARLIYLIGYMACGKTTLGRALAEKYPVDFVDLDSFIEQSASMSVSEIFSKYGEEHFRRLERSALHDVSKKNSIRTQIVACGGGTPCYFDNIDIMLTNGEVVWLNASVEKTVQRILDAGDSRPKVAGMDRAELTRYVVDNLAQRKPYYSRAGASFDSSHLDTCKEIDQSVECFAKQFNL